jgi:hypothetical protein
VIRSTAFCPTTLDNHFLALVIIAKHSVENGNTQTTKGDPQKILSTCGVIAFPQEAKSHYRESHGAARSPARYGLYEIFPVPREFAGKISKIWSCLQFCSLAKWQ